MAAQTAKLDGTCRAAQHHSVAFSAPKQAPVRGEGHTLNLVTSRNGQAQTPCWLLLVAALDQVLLVPRPGGTLVVLTESAELLHEELLDTVRNRPR